MTVAFILGQFAETLGLHCCNTNRAALTTLLTDTSCPPITRAVSANLSITNNILCAKPEECPQCLAHKHGKSERLVNSRQNLPNKKKDSAHSLTSDIKSSHMTVIETLESLGSLCAPLVPAPHRGQTESLWDCSCGV